MNHSPDELKLSFTALIASRLRLTFKEASTWYQTKTIPGLNMTAEQAALAGHSTVVTKYILNCARMETFSVTHWSDSVL